MAKPMSTIDAFLKVQKDREKALETWADYSQAAYEKSLDEATGRRENFANLATIENKIANKQPLIKPEIDLYTAYQKDREALWNQSNAALLANMDRDLGTVIADTAQGLAQATYIPAATILGAGAGAIADLGQAVFTGGKNTDMDITQSILGEVADQSKALRENESLVLQGKRENVGYKADNAEAAYMAALPPGQEPSTFDVQVNRALATMGGYGSDPVLLTQDVVNNLPTLGVGKVGQVAGRGVLNKVVGSLATNPTVEQLAARATATKWAERAGVGAATGTLEGSSAIPTIYQQGLEEGLTPDESMSAAFKGGAITAVATGISSGLISNFDRSLLSASGRAGLGRVVHNVLDLGAETFQEGVEETTTTVAGNYALRSEGANVGLWDDTGDSFGAGAAVGAGTTAGIRAPSMASNAVIAGVKGAVNHLTSGMDIKQQSKVNENAINAAKGIYKSAGVAAPTTETTEKAAAYNETHPAQTPINDDPVTLVEAGVASFNNKGNTPVQRAVGLATAITGASLINETESDKLKGMVNSRINDVLEERSTDDLTQVAESLVQEAETQPENAPEPITKAGVPKSLGLEAVSRLLPTLGTNASEEVLRAVESTIPGIGPARGLSVKRIVDSIREEKQLNEETQQVQESLPKPTGKTAEEVKNNIRSTGFDTKYSTGLSGKLARLRNAIALGDQKAAAYWGSDISAFYQTQRTKLDAILAVSNGNPTKSQKVTWKNPEGKIAGSFTVHPDGRSAAGIAAIQADVDYLAKGLNLARKLYGREFVKPSSNITTSVEESTENVVSANAETNQTTETNQATFTPEVAVEETENNVTNESTPAKKATNKTTTKSKKATEVTNPVIEAIEPVIQEEVPTKQEVANEQQQEAQEAIQAEFQDESEGSEEVEGTNEVREVTSKEEADKPINKKVKESFAADPEVEEDKPSWFKTAVKNAFRHYINLDMAKSIFANGFQFHSQLQEGSEIAQDASELLKSFNKTLNDNIKPFLKQHYEAFISGNAGNLQQHPDKLSLHAILVDNGRARYHPVIVNAMSVTMLQFLAENPNMDSFRTEVFDEEGEATSDRVDVPLVQKALADMLKTNLGASFDKNVTPVLTEGVLNALAGDMIGAFITTMDGYNSPLLKDVFEGEGESRIVLLETTPLYEKMLGDIREQQTSNMFKLYHEEVAKVLPITPHRVPFVLEAPANVPNKVRFRSFFKISKTQRIANKNMSAVPYNVKTDVANVFWALTRKSFAPVLMKLVGTRQVLRHASKEFIAAERAKINNFNAALRAVQDIRVATGEDDSTPVFYPHQTVGGGRSMMSGVSPQSNTYLRAMVSHVQGEAPINRLTPLRLAWAQSWGIKTDINDPKTILARWMEVEQSEAFRNAVADVLKLMENPDHPADVLLEYLSSFKDDELKPEMFNVLTDSANLLLARQKGMKEFGYTTYYEDDGKTDGFANAFQMLGLKGIGRKSIAFSFFSGKFLGMPAGTRLAHIQDFLKKNFGAVDAYEYVSMLATKSLVKGLNDPNTKHKEAILELLNLLEEAGLYKDGKFTRPFSKQPVTAAQYLQGEYSRTLERAGALFDHILFEINTNPNANLELYSKVLGIPKNQLIRTINTKNGSEEIKSSLMKTLTEFISPHLEYGVQNLIGPFAQTLSAIVDYTKHLADEANKSFTADIERVTAEMIEAGTLKKGNPLPKSVVDAAIERSAALFPRILVNHANPDQGMALMRINPVAVGGTSTTSLSGRFNLNLRQDALWSPDTSAAATLVIGGGDAAMMTELFQRPVKVLNTFDGAQVDPYDADEIGTELNQAVIKNWGFNVAEKILEHMESIEKILPDVVNREGTVEKGGEKVRQVMKMPSRKQSIPQTPGYAVGPDTSWKEIKAQLKKVANNHRKSLKIQDAVGGTVDHMAGTSGSVPFGSPVTNEIVDAVDALQSRLEEATADLADVETTGVINPEVLDAVRAFGVANGSDRVIQGNVVDFLNTLVRASDNPLHKALWTMLRPLVPESLKITEIGKRKDFIKISQDEEAVGYTKGLDIYVLPNISTQEILHEVFHASTRHLTTMFFDDTLRAQLTPIQRQSLFNIRRLMDQWIAQTKANRSANPLDAALLAVLEDNLTTEEMLQEFMAYTLTSQDHLARLAEMLVDKEGVQAVKPLSTKYAERVKNLFFRMLGIKGTNLQNYVQNSFGEQLVGHVSNLLRNSLPNTGKVLSSGLAVRGASFGGSLDTKLSFVLEALAAKVRNNPDNVYYGHREVDLLNAVVEGINQANVLIDAGVALDAGQKQDYKALYALMSARGVLPANAQSLATKVAEKVVQEGYTLFRTTTDPTDTVDIRRAKKIAIAFAKQKHNRGAALLALAMVNPTLMNKLKNIEFTKEESKNLDQLISNSFAKGLDVILRRATTNNKDAAQLTQQLAETIEAINEEKLFSELRPESLIRKAETAVSDMTEKLGDAALQQAQELNESGKQYLGSIVASVAALGSKTAAKAIGSSLLESASAFHDAIGRVFMDLVGSTEENFDLYATHKRMKKALDDVRQGLRMGVPKEVRSWFTRELTKEDNKGILDGILNADLGVFNDTDALRAISSQSNLNNMIDVRESGLRGVLGGRTTEVLKAAKKLAKFIQKGEGSTHWRNAGAIANFVANDSKTEKMINELVTLYALDEMSNESKAALRELTKEEEKGIKGVLSFQRELTNSELTKKNSGNSYNIWKGYSFKDSNPNKLIVLAPQSQQMEMERLGYRHVEDYAASPEDETVPLAYYASTTAAKPAFNLGVIPATNLTVGGVDEVTGRSNTPYTGTLITYGPTVKKLTALLDQGALSDKLIPVFTKDGMKIKAFERVMDRDLVDAHIEQDGDVSRILGQWLARQHEETIAYTLLDKNIERLKEFNEKNPKQVFVDVTKDTDPVVQDTWEHLPYYVKQRLLDAFRETPGQKDKDVEVLVPKLYLAETLGIRNASITDIYTGTSRLSKESRQALEAIAEGILGKNGYRYLQTAERGVQEVVRFARTNIIVKSLGFILGNAASSYMQFTRYGISYTQGAKRYVEKHKELISYHDNRNKITKLIAQQKANPSQEKQLQMRINILRDANKKLSIWKLIEAGEYISGAEGIDESADFSIFSNPMNWIKEKADKAPKVVKELFRQGIVTEDTALYQGLQRLVQAGDFTAKAVVFDHLMETGMSERDALKSIQDEFVNYTTYAGRNRQLLESYGILNFYNFKIRSLKGIYRGLRDNPLAFLRYVVTANALGVDSLLDSAIPLDSLGYSIGPEMTGDALASNFWKELFQ